MRLWYKRNGIEGERIFPYHYCTAEELDEFAPPVQDSVGLFEIYKKSDTRHLYCLDWEKFGNELSIWGTENDEIAYQRLEYVLLPCNYVHAEFGPTDDYKAKDCNDNRDEQIKYLGNMRLIVLTTEQVFNQQEYDSEVIETRSRFFTSQIDPNSPTWLSGELTVNELED